MPYLLDKILIILITFSLAIFVLSRDRYNEINQSFCLLGMMLVIWNVRYLLIEVSPGPELALTWLRTVVPNEFFVPAAFYHFVLAILQDHTRSKRILLALAYST